MALSTHTTTTGKLGLNICYRSAHLLLGFLLPSIHSQPAFFTSVLEWFCSDASWNENRQQVHPGSLITQTDAWKTLILKYARHRKLFTIRVEDCEAPGNEWAEVLRNERINSGPRFLLELSRFIDFYRRKTTAFISILHSWSNGIAKACGIWASKTR